MFERYHKVVEVDCELRLLLFLIMKSVSKHLLITECNNIVLFVTELIIFIKVLCKRLFRRPGIDDNKTHFTDFRKCLQNYILNFT